MSLSVVLDSALLPVFPSLRRLYLHDVPSLHHQHWLALAPLQHLRCLLIIVDPFEWRRLGRSAKAKGPVSPLPSVRHVHLFCEAAKHFPLGELCPNAIDVSISSESRSEVPESLPACRRMLLTGVRCLPVSAADTSLSGVFQLSHRPLCTHDEINRCLTAFRTFSAPKHGLNGLRAKNSAGSKGCGGVSRICNRRIQAVPEQKNRGNHSRSRVCTGLRFGGKAAERTPSQTMAMPSQSRREKGMLATAKSSRRPEQKNAARRQIGSVGANSRSENRSSAESGTTDARRTES